MNLIFASDSNGLIGLNGSMPWVQKADLRRFAKLTMASSNGMIPCVIMGRKTFESLNGYSLPGRNRVIVSSGNLQHFDDNRSLLWMTAKEVLDFVPKFRVENTAPCWVIGGAQIYDLLLPFVDTIYWTKINTSVTINPTDEAVYWHNPLFKFNCVEQSELYPADEDNQFSYQFMKFKRMRT